MIFTKPFLKIRASNFSFMKIEKKNKKKIIIIIPSQRSLQRER